MNADLNFLYLIDALYEMGSVSKAAEKLGLTQPAVSHGLARMRLKFNDELFVRSGSGMCATPTGERVAIGARKTLDLIQTEIWGASTFNASTSDRTFSIGMTDMGGTFILPRVIKTLEFEAPFVKIKPIAVRPSEVNDFLETGAIDVAWGYFGNLTSRLYQQTLFRRSLVGIIRKVTDVPPVITFKTFVSMKHVFASATSLTNALLAQNVREKGETLHVALEVPYLLAIPGIVANSNYIASVPSELADLFLRLASIQVFDLPLSIPVIGVKQYWHHRYHGDAGHQWFRTMVQHCVGVYPNL